MKKLKGNIFIEITVVIFFISIIGMVVWGMKSALDSPPEDPLTSINSSELVNPTIPTDSSKTSAPISNPNYTLTTNGDKGIDVQLKTKTPFKMNFPVSLSSPITIALSNNHTIQITQKSKNNFTLISQDQTNQNSKLLSIIQKDPILSTYKDTQGNLNFYTYQDQKNQKSKTHLFKNWILYKVPTKETQQIDYEIKNAVVNIDSSGDAQVYYTSKQGKNSKLADFTIPRPYFLDKDTNRTNLDWKFNKSSHLLSVSFTAIPSQYPIALDPSVEKTDTVIATFSGKSIRMCGCGSSCYTVSGSGNDTHTYGTVVAEDGNCWLDRNLGATEVATSSDDSAAYGWYYQWGRLTDGHQIGTSGTTATLSSTDVPGHANFITNGSDPYDWRDPQNDNLWQGVNGINNPCPTGFRLPTKTEWETLYSDAGITDSATAYSSSLKFTVGGWRKKTDGSLAGVGSAADYWTSTVSGTLSAAPDITSSSVAIYNNDRAYGLFVRCIRD